MSEFCKFCGRELGNSGPLSLEQLRERDGKPIYIIVLRDDENRIEQNERWEILDRKCPVDFEAQDVNLECGDCYPTYTLGKTYNMYDYPPKEATT